MDSRVKDFAQKISRKLVSSDFKGLYSKEGVSKLIKEYGYPLKEDEINDANWEDIYDTLMS